MLEPISSSQMPAPSPLDEIHTADLPLFAPPQRYEIRQEIGRGFSSIVYEAYDTLRGRAVALKVLTLGQTLSEERRLDMAERFLREARAISALSHLGIVSIYEVGQAGAGRHFIAMELLEGESLRARMDREAPLPPEDAVPIALQTADALEYAHLRGIVHRDVKPDNIYVLPDGRVKLMDFGVAHIVSEGTLTQTGTVVGSPAYMSPEQISGLPLTGGSDVFSLGVTLAEMLTGQKPFDASSIPAVMNKILHRPPQIDSIQPRALRKVLAQSLAKNPAVRYSSAGIFAEALRRQMRPAVAGAWANQTIIMDAPQPGLDPAGLSASGTIERAQEPPSRTALWTFGVAGLLLLLGIPFAFSRLSSAPAPLPSVSAQRLPTPAQRVASSAPVPHIVRIPAAWRRQPVVPPSLHKQTPVRPAPVLHPLVKPAKIAASISVPLPTASHPAVSSVNSPRTMQAAKAILPAAKHTQAAVLIARAPRPQISSHSGFHKTAAHPVVVRVADSRQEHRQPLPIGALRTVPAQAISSPPPILIPDSPPRALRRIAAMYPSSLRANGIGGIVLVRVSVNAQGAVTEATVVQSSGTDDLDAAALDAIGSWFYEPAYQNGQAVPSQTTVRFDFHP